MRRLTARLMLGVMLLVVVVAALKFAIASTQYKEAYNGRAINHLPLLQ